MMIVLLLIPILCVSLSLYIMTLINFIAFNELDNLLFLGTMLINIVTSFFIFKLIIKNGEQYALIMNMSCDFSNYYGYFSLILLFIFSISLIIHSVVNGMNIIHLTIGIILSLLFLVVTYLYFFKRERKELVLNSINEYNEYLNILYFYEDNHNYKIFLSKKINLVENKKYLCLVSKYSNTIKKIKKEIN